MIRCMINELIPFKLVDSNSCYCVEHLIHRPLTM